jgi:hypothetical protein
MPFTILVERRRGFVRYEVSGPPSLKNYFDLIERAAFETRATGDRRALVDLRGVLGRLRFTDQMFIGEVAAEKLQHLERLAIVVSDDPQSYNSAKVANRKGLPLGSFSSDDAAVAWLLGSEATP